MNLFERIFTLFKSRTPHKSAVTKFRGLMPPDPYRYNRPTGTKYKRPHQGKRDCERRIRQGLA